MYAEENALRSILAAEAAKFHKNGARKPLLCYAAGGNVK